MNFWAFADKHPFAALLAVLSICATCLGAVFLVCLAAESVAGILRGR